MGRPPTPAELQRGFVPVALVVDLVDSPPEYGIAGLVIVTLFGLLSYFLRKLLIQTREDVLGAKKEQAAITTQFTAYLQRAAENAGRREESVTVALNAAAEGFKTVSKTLDIMGTTISNNEERAIRRHEEHMAVIQKLADRVNCPKEEP